MNLPEQFVQYLNSQKKKPSKATVKNYKADILHFIHWFENQFKKTFDPLSVTPQIIELYKTSGSATASPAGEKFQHQLSPSSIKRHTSSLKKFFYFLKIEGLIAQDPTKSLMPTATTNLPEDKWRLKDFKNHLYVYNASPLTIKNYIMDVRQFMNWAEQVTKINKQWQTADKNIFDRLDWRIIEEYKLRLIGQHFSPLTINRKLSSLRKYLSWAKEEGIVKKEAPQIKPLGTGIFSSVPQPITQQPQYTPVPVEQAFATQAQEEKSATQAQPETAQDRRYSKIPPVRLVQKVALAGDSLFDAIFIEPVALLARGAEFMTWKLKGKPVFEKSKTSNEPLQVYNIKKEFYSPISTKNMSAKDKALHHLKFTRPRWYFKYHSYPFVHYLHFGVLVILMCLLGFYLFQNLNPQTTQITQLIDGSSTKRTLVFQGKLADSGNNPITGQTQVKFTIYDTQKNGGKALWTETNTINPKSDGTFSAILGNKNPLYQEMFVKNYTLWLGIAIGTDPELVPRQQLANVALSENAQTLDGLPPITQSKAGNKNVVLALDSSGNLTIGGKASSTFQAIGGQFSLSGNVLSLTTIAGTDSDIILTPDGLGKVNIQKPIYNSSNSTNLSGIEGAVEIADVTSIIASSSAYPALVINQNDTGAIISASSSGVAKFTVDGLGNTILGGNLIIEGKTISASGLTDANFGNSSFEVGKINTTGNFTQTGATTFSTGTGNTNINGNIILGDSASDTFTFTGRVAQDSDLIPATTTGASDLGAANFPWSTLYVKQVKPNGSDGQQGWWSRSGTTLSPSNSGDNISIGGTLGVTGATTLSSTLTVSGASTLSSTLAVTGNTTIGGTLGATGATTLSSTLGVSGATTLSSTLSVTGDTTLTGDLAVNGGDITTSATTFNLINSTATTLNIGNAATTVSIGAATGTTTVRNALTATGLITANGGLTVPSGQTTTLSSFTSNGGPLYTNASGVVSQITAGTSTQVLHGGSTPTFGAVVLTTDVSGTLPIANGGTNSTATPTAGAVAYGTGSAYAFSNAGSASQCLLSGGTGAPTWGACALGGGNNFWDQANGTLYPYNSTVDFLVGGQASSSAKFAVLNVNSGTPTASVSAGAAGAAFLKADGNLATTAMQSLTLGGSTTGNIVIDSGTGTVNLADATASRIVFTDSSKNLTYSAASSVLAASITDEVGSGFAVFGTSPTLTTSLLTDSTSFDLLNTTATTINFGGAATAINVGAAAGSTLTFGGAGTIKTTTTGALTLDSGTTGTVSLGTGNNAKTVNIATGTAGNTVNIATDNTTADAVNIGSALDTTTIGGTVNLSGGTASRFVITDSSKNLTYSAASSVLSASITDETGSDKVVFSTSPTFTTSLLTGSTSLDLFNTTATTVNFAGAGTTVSIGAATGTTTINNATTAVTGNLTIGGTTGITANGNGAGITFAGTGNHDISASSGTLRLGAATLTGAITGNSQSITGLNNLSAAGTVTFSGYNANNNVLYATVSTGVVAGASTSSTNLCLISGATAPTWGSCASGLTNDILWGQSNGALYPNNSTVDLLIGAQATASAKFAFINVNAGTPTATVSGNLSLAVPTTAGTNTLNLLNNSALNIQNSVGGDSGLTTALYISNRGGSGNVGIGTTVPNNRLEILSTTTPQLRVAYDTSNYYTTAVSSTGAVTFDSNGTGAAFTFSDGVTANTFASSGVTISGGSINGTTIGASTPSTGAFTTLTSSGNTTLGTGASGVHTYSTGAGSTTTLGNSTGALTIASGGTSAWTNTAGNLTIQTATSGTMTIDSAGALNLGTTNSTATSIGKTATTLTINPTSWTATPTISGLITATSGLTSNGTLTVADTQTLTANGVVNLGDNGDNVVINSNVWDITGAGVASGLTGLSSSGTITFSGFTSNGGVLYTNGSGVLAQATAGTSSQCLLGGTTPSFGSCASGLTNDILWGQSNGALYPNNSTVDLLIGAQATASAKFAFINVNAGTPTATVSGNLSLAVPTTAGTNTLNLLNNSALNIQNSVGGDSGLTTALYISNRGGSGNVGIGTTVPGVKLDVVGDIRAGTGATLTNDYGQSLYFSVDASPVNVSAIRMKEHTTDNYGLEFQTYSTSLGTRMTILGNGNVGIGTTAPGTALQVVGNVQLGTSSSTADQGVNLVVQGTASQPAMYVQGNAARSASTDVIFSMNRYGVAGGFQVFGDHHAYFSSNVGIGTTAPETLLDIAGGQLMLDNNQTYMAEKASGANVNLMKLNTSNVYQFADGSAGFQFLTENFTTPLVTIQNGGNVGIGTTSPDQKLHVMGNIQLGDDLSASPYWLSIISAGASQQAGIRYGTEASPASKWSIWGTTDDSNLHVSMGATEHMRVSSSGGLSLGSGYVGTDPGAGSMIIAGNVGIGTTAPAGGLQVSNSLTGNTQRGIISSPTFSAAPADISVGISIQPTVAAAITVPELRSLWIPSPTVSGTLTNYYGIRIDANPTVSTSKYGIFVDTLNSYFGGNVGIGTTAPTASLHIVPSGTTNAFGALIAGTIDRSGGGTAQAASALKLTTAITPDNNAAAPGRSIYGLYANLGTMTGISAAVNNTFADVAITPATTSLPGAGSLTNRVGLYIDSAPAGATNNYALWVDAGTSRFDGPIQLQDTTSSLDSLGDMTFNIDSNNDQTGRQYVWAHNATGASGTTLMTLLDVGQLQLPITGSTGGLLLGADANLYRSAADVLTTDDSFSVVTKAAVGQSAIASNVILKIAGSTNTAGSGGSALGIFGGTVTATANGDGIEAIYATTTIAKGGFTGLNSYGIYIDANAQSGTGTILNANGLYVAAQTIGTNNIGVKIDASSTQTLWVSANADNTTAAAGMAFGLNKDTNLYRSAANILKTDDTFYAKAFYDGDNASYFLDPAATSTSLAIAGSAGIGTTSLLATLDVRGLSGTTPAASVSAQTAFSAMVVDNSGIGDIFTASSSGTSRFVVKQSGNVGIGTTAPSEILHLSAAADTAIRFQARDVPNAGSNLDTGAVSPGTGANFASIGTNAWTNPGNITASENTYATNATAGVTQGLRASNFGFSIPTNGTIVGIKVEIERKVSGGGTTNKTFTYAGAFEDWVVPAGVTSVTVDGYGAAGYNSAFGGSLGGRVQATLPVTPGQTLRVYVGGAGTSSTAGFNGGGAPGSAFPGTGYGGGASDIRQGGTGLADRIIVMGGGGGYSEGSGGAVRGAGGNGGGTTGGAGGNAAGGGGGTGSGGGAGGVGASSTGSTGASGVGGAGGSGGTGNLDGGGGGGGYYGGGGGGGGFYVSEESFSPAGGGGGGSSFTGTGVTGVTHTQGYASATGNGSVVFTYALPDVTDSTVKLIKADGTAGTTNKSTGASWPITEAYTSFGGASDLWGDTWTPADINDTDFGAVLSASVGTGSTASVDHMRITVYYTAPADVNWVAGVDYSATGTFKISRSTVLGTTDRLSIDNTGVKVTSGYTGGTVGALDYAELYEASENVDKAEIVEINPASPGKVRKSTQAYSPQAIGIVSTNPASVIEGNQVVFVSSDYQHNPLKPAVALAGRVPVKVSTENGPIAVGDYITSSSVPGVGMKATKAGQIIGKALESFGSPSETSVQEGKIIVFVNTGWHDPDVYLTDTGDLNIAQTTDYSPQAAADSSSPIYRIFKTAVDGSQSTISRIGAFGTLVAANIKAGAINAKSLTIDQIQLTSNNFSIAGQNIRDYIAGVVTEIINNQQSTINGSQLISPIASIDQIHTGLISPLASSSAIAIKLDSNKLSILSDSSASGSAVAEFDNVGNATFSGTLTVNRLQTTAVDSSQLTVNGEATISGTLRADRIIANQIDGLEARLATVSSQTIVTNNFYATPSANLGVQPLTYTLSASESASLAYVSNLMAETATFNQGLIALGPSSLMDASIVGQLSINSSLILADNSINVLGADLEIQPFRQGGISFLSGLIHIDTEGNLNVGGNANFTKDVTVNGKLFAGLLSPIPDGDLVINLATKSGNLSQQFRINNATGSAVFTVNNLGDLVSSGSATVAKLNFSFVAPALATSLTDAIATGSAGVATISAQQTELTIHNPLVTENSLIYITPVGNPNGQTPYLLRQTPRDSFTTGIQLPSAIDTTFNWLIIN